VSRVIYNFLFLMNHFYRVLLLPELTPPVIFIISNGLHNDNFFGHLMLCPCHVSPRLKSRLLEGPGGATERPLTAATTVEGGEKRSFFQIESELENENPILGRFIMGKAAYHGKSYIKSDSFIIAFTNKSKRWRQRQGSESRGSLSSVPLVRKLMNFPRCESVIIISSSADGVFRATTLIPTKEESRLSAFPSYQDRDSSNVLSP